MSPKGTNQEKVLRRLKERVRRNPAKERGRDKGKGTKDPSKSISKEKEGKDSVHHSSDAE